MGLAQITEDCAVFNGEDTPVVLQIWKVALTRQCNNPLLHVRQLVLQAGQNRADI